MTAPHEAPAAEAAIVHAAIERWLGTPGALLPILHEVQDGLGHIPRHAVPEIAAALNLTRAEVHGVVTYYHHFRSEPAGCHVVQICQAESCRSMGAEALVAHAQQRLGCGEGQGAPSATSPDGRYTLEPVYCLGLCAMSPAMSIDGRPHARVSSARFDACISALERAEGASA